LIALRVFVLQNELMSHIYIYSHYDVHKSTQQKTLNKIKIKNKSAIHERRNTKYEECLGAIARSNRLRLLHVERVNERDRDRNRDRDRE
jgi:hypothetical protein